MSVMEQKLLEQNVRSFCQVGDEIVNYGIRKYNDWMMKKFFAYNNGIAAIADHIELDDSGHYILESEITNC